MKWKAVIGCVLGLLFVSWVLIVAGHLAAQDAILSGGYTGTGTPTVTPSNPPTPTPPSVSPTNITFQDQQINTVSKALNVTLTNSLPTVLTINSLTVSTNFGITNNGCGSSLAANSSCTFGVTFSPTLVQCYSGTVTIADSSIGVNYTQTIPVSGDGVSLPTPNETPGANLYSEIASASHPNGFAFYLACGTYRLPVDDGNHLPLKPKPNQTFTGCAANGTCPPPGAAVPASPPCADITGAIVVSSWSGSSPWQSTVGTGNVITGTVETCNDANSACNHAQDLFYDNVVVPRTTNSSPPAGFWYLDETNGIVYLNKNPTGHTVELTVTPQAFTSQGTNNTGVTLQNLTIEKFAPANQVGAVETWTSGWTVRNNWITHNHGWGLKARPGSGQTLFKYNEAIENGQGGIGGGTANNLTVDSNDVRRNNEDGVNYGQECGGMKFSAATTGVLIQNNTIAYNNCVGLWDDVGTSGTTLSNNTVIGNLLQGIRHETSTTVSIIKNTVTDNNQYNDKLCIANGVPQSLNTKTCCSGAQTGPCGTACDVGGPQSSGQVGEIIVVNSNNATVGGSTGNGNTVVSNCAGILLSSGGAIGNGAQPETGNTVSYNSIQSTINGGLPQNTNGGQNCSGSCTPRVNMFASTSNNLFDHNSWCFLTSSDATQKNWEWGTSCVGPTNSFFSSFGAWQGCEDAHGVITITSGVCPAGS